MGGAPGVERHAGAACEACAAKAASNGASTESVLEGY
jgi:hypothetical protein